MLKPYSLLIIFLFSALQTYSQNTPKGNLFSLPSQSSKTSLSKLGQNRLENFNRNPSYLSVKLLQIENIERELGKERISLDLLNGMKGMTVSKKLMDLSSESDFLYSGEIDGGGMMVLGRQNGGVSGNIRKDGRVFDIEYLEKGLVALIEYDMKKVNAEQCGIQEEKIDKVYEEKKSNLDSQSSKSPIWIDVLVLFTPAVAATGRNIAGLANTARGQWLSSQLNSNVSPNLRIAAVRELDFVENQNDDNISEDIRRLNNNITAQQLRNQFAADIVILITRGNYPGIAGIVPEIGPREGSAYSIVQVDAATSSFTMIHEIGHLFGARHEFSSDNTPGDAHGHQWKTGWWPFRKRYNSVMKRNNGGECVAHFSNPYVEHQSRKTGVVGVSHNVRNINANGRSVEDFRFTAPAMATFITGPALADDGQRLSFSSSVNNGSSPLSYRWQVNTGSGYFGSWSGSSLSYTMPTGKDLRVRLTVTGSDGRSATTSTSVRNSFLGGGPCTECPDTVDLSDTLDSEISSETIGSLEPVLYPNPASNTIYIDKNDGLLGFDQYAVFDLNGTMVRKFKIDGGTSIAIDISSLSKGIYVLKLLGQGTSRSYRFIKK